MPVFISLVELWLLLYKPATELRAAKGCGLKSDKVCDRNVPAKNRWDEEEVDEEEVDEVHALTVFSSKTQKKGLFFPADVVYNVN